MNPIHVRLIFNHFPILGTIFGILVLVYGSLKKSDEICRLALWTFVLSFLSAVPVCFTGEKAEYLVQPMLNLSEAFIERHEEAGELGFALACALGLRLRRHFQILRDPGRLERLQTLRENRL